MFDRVVVAPDTTWMPIVPPAGAVVPLLGTTVVVIVRRAPVPLVIEDPVDAMRNPIVLFGTCTVTGPVLVVIVTLFGTGIGNFSFALTVTPVPPTTTILVASVVLVPINCNARVIVRSAQASDAVL